MGLKTDAGPLTKGSNLLNATKRLERNSIFISERLSNISHLWNCVYRIIPTTHLAHRWIFRKWIKIKGLINAHVAVAQHRAGVDVAFHSVKCCMCTHGSCSGSCIGNTQEVRMTDGSVPPLCQAGFNPTALWLRSSVSLMMRKDGAGQRFDRREQCETDTFLPVLYAWEKDYWVNGWKCCGSCKW